MRIIIILFIIIFYTIPAAAQIVIKEGNLYLHPDSKVSIRGAVINHGNIHNQGVVSLTGDWQNLSSYASSGGTIVLNGSDAQVFFHNSQRVGILLIDNPAYINLTTDVTVGEKLLLKEGVVIPDAGSKLIIAEEAEVEGGASGAYIHGVIYHTGKGNKFYPVGKNGQYAPVTLSQVEGEGPVVGVEFYNQTVQTLESNEMKLQEFYWSLSTLLGKFEGSPLTLDVLLENPDLEEDRWVMVGSEHLNESFKVLDKVHVQMLANRFTFSSSKFLNSKYITLGIPEGVKELFFIPNALSPSAPHPEDRAIKIYSKNIEPESFQWTIWDNWGQIVYATNSYEQASATGWQATHKGKGEALPGIYKYFLQGKLHSGQAFSQKGNIILYK
jgi:hypothetical protein